MTHQVTRTITLHHVERYGGLFSYWKLVRQIHDQVFAFNMPRMYMKYLIKLPWWLIIKPLGWFFSTLRIYKGTYVVVDGWVTKSSVTKSTSIRLLNVPLISWYTSILSEADWTRLDKRVHVHNYVKM